MAMTLRETQNQWRKHNELRKGFFNRWARLWAIYYNEQMGLLLTDRGAFTQRSVEALFVKMYEDVGGEFAALSFATTKSSSLNLITKEGETDGPRSVSSGMALNWDEYMANYARTAGAQSIVSISATGLADGRALIQSITSQAIEQGLGADETAAWIEREIPKQWKIKSKFNALRIARTEIIAASNEGAFKGASDTGLELNKIWLTAMDGRERQSHAAANGQSVAMSDMFTLGDGVRISKPGAKGAPPEDVINCRCAVGYQSVVFARQPNQRAF